MNRFRSKKKERSDASVGRPSIEDASGPFKMFGRNKKVMDDGKQEVNLTTALPPSDDFRTSLLMTGLSARFSMLREQDDPSSKIGKASDDSVLFPKRQSRMDLAVAGGLHDIAEVESIRAPFARVDSFVSSDDNTSYTGSIMNRAKPTEGNNLFGGRQKIYRIPAGGSSKNGVLPGRALYEDDVALSAFQRWRQAEKERRASGEDFANDSLDIDRLDYDRRRETSSTTSSAPSGARDSTAATSVTSSQPTPSLKDWQSNTVAAPSATAMSGPERSVTRTRRLYENGLTQDLQDQQSSATSRFDNLSRPRPLASRMADLTSKTSTVMPQVERPSDRRPLGGKASAPNLRSFSPKLGGSSLTAPIESASRFPSLEQQQTKQIASPPLSPPISETGDHIALSIQPNDRGKATAMGVFTRPSQQYDESRYAQRQRQLQQGRETPTNGERADSETSSPATRSRSSSIQPGPFDRNDPNLSVLQPSLEERSRISSSKSHPTLPVTLERPSDHDHPAFRQSALPTPLSISSRNTSNDTSPTAEKSNPLDGLSTHTSSDSPTLGPPAGLSGMVRQHLRNISTASSVYGNGGHNSDEEDNAHHPPHRASLPRVSVDNEDWGLNEQEWNQSYGTETSPPNLSSLAEGASRPEQDDFARHLAEGARRVRERLTSYAEPDGTQTGPPALPYSETTKDTTPKQNINIVRSKTSRTSVADRTKDSSEGLHKMASLRIRPSSRGTSPSSRRQERLDEQHVASGEQPSVDRRDSGEKGEGAPTGLKAFRQARREMQRMKQIETRQRHNGPASPPQAPTSQPPPPPPDRAAPAPFSHKESHTPLDRERSESGTSKGGYSRTGAMGSAGRMSPSVRSPTMSAADYRRPALTDHSDGPTLQGAASTPNLNGGSAAPPLPPINPRRKTPQGRGPIVRGSEDEAGLASSNLPLTPSKNGRLSDPEHSEHLRGRGTRASPPRSMPRPLPQTSNSSSSMPGGIPGGMI